MTARTGAQYKAGLADSRTVWLGSQKVDILTHPAFAGSIEGMAGYFDWQNRFADDCLVDDPDTGAPMNASLILPRGADDLARRHRAFERLSQYSYGMLGRTPDYVNVTLAGFTARADVFSPTGADRLRRFYREVVDGDLSMTHTIIQPAIDKSIPDTHGINGELAARVVRRTDTGVVVRGAKVLATLGPFADELFVYPAAPLPPGTPAEYALCFSVPMATKGLHTLCRDHCGTADSRQDHPFSSRFDEQDAYMIFDDVEVPYERLFIDCDIEVYNGLRRAGWAANVFQQTSIRAAVKLEFAYDLCLRMAQVTNSETKPDVAAALGEIWAYAQLTRAATRAAEAGAHDQGNGAFFLDDRPLRAIRSMMPAWMIRVNEIIKSLGSHNLLATPSLSLFDNGEIGPLLEQLMPGARGVSARERAEVFRTAWDFAGSALGGRVELYERFYLASQQKNFTRDHSQFLQESGGAGFGLFSDFLREIGGSPIGR
ncbi:4-hydroxyphenylacetate 3-hydroxylase N-terminal domain-containing protein [Rhodopila sp.]|uniref:4-hydroxyphenylacetate 3-hydroxylase N-terminal domain-containing protein n=1 Tax=Rhodopila sp. TaxID=2480087 RepID=UPI002CC9290D|nr:4-hydroxyphenylacetate 3-hydroxylase N-terminal domain-containing protein [Rhodopila sp.]HVZ08544.1 4-hydroxyphenylacetate 3-hydroxylase N-terminal domain-containing protein [Rhodopila sp.]